MKYIEKQSPITSLMSRVTHDSRLKVCHIALITGIIELAQQQNEFSKIKMSRRLLMKYSHINTAPTYHKYLKELQELNYIKYNPSFDPRISSTLEILL